MNAVRTMSAGVLGAVMACLSSCGQNSWDHGGAPPAQTLKRDDVTVVQTLLDDMVEVARRDDKDGRYVALVGAYSQDVGGVPQAAVGKANFDRKVQGAGTDAAAEVESGWAYVISPPRWPIVRTPRQRGGIQAGVAIGAAAVHVLAYTDGSVERIFFLGAFDATNQPVDCMLHVDANPPHTSVPVFVDLKVGEYAEVVLDPVTLDWSDITVGQFPVTDGNSPQDVRDFVNYVRLRAANHGMAWPTGLTIP